VVLNHGASVLLSALGIHDGLMPLMSFIINEEALHHLFFDMQYIVLPEYNEVLREIKWSDSSRETFIPLVFPIERHSSHRLVQ